MSNRLARFGNDLHSGRTSYPFVQKRGLWLAVSLALIVVSICLLYTSPSPRDATLSRMPSSA